MKAIRLFARNCITFRCNTLDEGRELIHEYIAKELKHNSQAPSINFQTTKRKKNPIDAELRYYSLETLKDIAEYYLNEKANRKGDE